MTTDEDIQDLYAQFIIDSESMGQETAFFVAVKSVLPPEDEEEKRSWVRYSPKLTDEICRRVARNESIRLILAPKDKPTWTTLLRWMDKYPEFGAKYEKALEHRADYICHQLAELAEMAKKDPKSANGYKVAANILQWQAAMGNPKKYSERMINIEEHEAPKSIAEVMAETARLCKELNVDMNLLIQHRAPT